MFISVITINRNNRDGLRQTMQSVLKQDFEDFEFIVVDGASDDGSLEVIKEFQPLFEQKQSENFQYESKPDTGIFNAMNKGILKSEGEYLLFLNSGDYLVSSDVLSNFSALNTVEDYVSGNIVIELDGRQEVRKSPDKVDFLFFFNNSLPHQATFIKKRVFETFGLYNEGNKVKSDWENSFRNLIIENSTYRHIEQIISYYDISGVSSQQEFEELKRQEQKIVYLSIMPSYVLDALIFYRREYETACSQKQMFDEYMTIKNGKFGWIVKLILRIKKSRRKFLKKSVL